MRRLVYAQWMQQVLNDIGDGVSNAFSAFVQQETERNFGDVPMLVMPGRGGG